MINKFREMLIYNQATGEFLWRKQCGSKKANSKAGSIKKDYLVIKLQGKAYFAHRIAFLMVYGWLPEKVDHKDGNGLNNKIKNLRACSHRQNQYNRVAHANKKNSLPKGVYLRPKSKNKYVSYIRVKGKQIYIGDFKTIKAAQKAYQKEAEKLQGDFAVHNSRKRSGGDTWQKITTDL